MFETTFTLPTANPAIPPVKLCPGTVPLVFAGKVYFSTADEPAMGAA